MLVLCAACGNATDAHVAPSLEAGAVIEAEASDASIETDASDSSIEPDANDSSIEPDASDAGIAWCAVQEFLAPSAVLAVPGYQG